MKNILTNIVLISILILSPILGICQTIIRSAPSNSKITLRVSNFESCPDLMQLELNPQKMSNWCYAASAQSILKFNNRNFNGSQLDIVKTLLDRPDFRGSDTCKSPTNEAINLLLPCDSNFKLVDFLHKNGLPNAQIGQFDKDKIKASLDGCKPVIAFINNGPGSQDDCGKSHVVVISGYSEVRKKIFLVGKGRLKQIKYLILDPLSECLGCKYFLTFDVDSNEFVSFANNTFYAKKNSLIITY